MYQAALNNSLRQRFLYGFQDAFMPISGDTFNLYTQSYKIVQILFNLLEMFTVCKTNQLCVAIFMVLITEQTEVFEVGRVHSQVYPIPLNNTHCRGLVQVRIEQTLKCIF